MLPTKKELRNMTPVNIVTILAISNASTFFLPAFHKWNKTSRRLQTILLPEFKLLFGFILLFRSCSFLLGIIIIYTLLSERTARTFVL